MDWKPSNHHAHILCFTKVSSPKNFQICFHLAFDVTLALVWCPFGSHTYHQIKTIYQNFASFFPHGNLWLKRASALDQITIYFQWFYALVFSFMLHGGDGVQLGFSLFPLFYIFIACTLIAPPLGSLTFHTAYSLGLSYVPQMREIFVYHRKISLVLSRLLTLLVDSLIISFLSVSYGMFLVLRGVAVCGMYSIHKARPKYIGARAPEIRSARISSAGWKVWLEPSQSIEFSVSRTVGASGSTIQISLLPYWDFSQLKQHKIRFPDKFSGDRFIFPQDISESRK